MFVHMKIMIKSSSQPQQGWNPCNILLFAVPIILKSLFLYPQRKSVFPVSDFPFHHKAIRNQSAAGILFVSSQQILLCTKEMQFWNRCDCTLVRTSQAVCTWVVALKHYANAALPSGALSTVAFIFLSDSAIGMLYDCNLNMLMWNTQEGSLR